MRNKIPDHGHGALGCVGDDGVPAICKPLELHDMRRQGGGDIRLALDRVNRIVFAAAHQGRALNAVEIGEHVVPGPSPWPKSLAQVPGPSRWPKSLACFEGDTKPYRESSARLRRQSHFWRTPSLNVIRFRCHADLVRPKCHPDFIKLPAPRHCPRCWRCRHRRGLNPTMPTRKSAFSSSKISCASSPARTSECNIATGSSKIA